jgi:hypothetical protein
MTITAGVWGPFYYGAFWSIFFVIWLGIGIERSGISRFLLTACFIPIFLTMFYNFSAINTVYKLHHYYPWHATSIGECFRGKEGLYDADQRPVFSGEELKWYIESYWLASRQKPSLVHWDALPRELYWLILELEPEKPHTRYELYSVHKYIPTLIFNFP